ncbi:MAG: alpha/beta hydrolase [Rickettsiales bacterium]|jgi:pimeloyl-ACP methyl ester carboxylesterase|nr:alpha/beta hydrolase [Rickettsiales bacterium]
MDFTRHSISLKTPDGKATRQLVFYDYGSPMASETVICVHGLTRNARDFDLLAEALVQQGQRRVLTLSMAGRGESDRFSDPHHYHYGTYVQDCLAVMDNFHLRQVDWVGTSMGGIIGMMIAANYPARIRKLVLNDIGSFLSKDALSRIYHYVGALPEVFASRAAAEHYLRENFAPWGITHEALWERLFATSFDERPDGTWRYLCDPAIAVPLRAASENFANIEDVSLAAIWNEVKIPTLILRGEISDILAADTVSAMCKSHVKAEAATIKGVGHAPALMEDSQIQIVVNWLLRDSMMRVAAAGI